MPTPPTLISGVRGGRRFLTIIWQMAVFKSRPGKGMCSFMLFMSTCCTRSAGTALMCVDSQAVHLTFHERKNFCSITVSSMQSNFGRMCNCMFGEPTFSKRPGALKRERQRRLAGSVVCPFAQACLSDGHPHAGL